MKAAVKQSPAPTVSIILYYFETSGLSLLATVTARSIVFVIILAPLEPSFSNIFKEGNLDNILSLMSATTFYSLMVGSILKSSVSFGDKKVRFLIKLYGIYSSLPPQSRITTFPNLFATYAARIFICIGISFCNIKISEL